MNNTANAEIKTASKSLVDALLLLNTNNRPIRKAVVDRYMRDIKAGKWVLTNQGIGVSDTNVLIDGQHRLEAIKRCGYPPVPLLVVYGLDDRSQLAVDQQAKRTPRDCLQFAFSFRVSRSAPAIGSLIHRINYPKIQRPTLEELMAIIEDHMEQIDFVSNVPKNTMFFAAPYLAAFVVAAKNGVDNERIAQFMRQVEDGEMLERWMPAFHLRNAILHGNARGGSSVVQMERFNKATKALEVFLTGDKMGVLRA